MDRGIKDEGFIRKALEIAESEDGRWIANQTFFNRAPDSVLLPSVRAALITAVNIYSAKNMIEEYYVDKALEVTTIGEAKNLIDELSSKIS